MENSDIIQQLIELQEFSSTGKPLPEYLQQLLK